MNIQLTLFSLVLALSPITLLAGTDHDHGHDRGHGHSHDPVNQSQAEKVAVESVAMLIKKGKIDSSWKSVSVANAEKKKFGDKMEWVVSFKNDKVSDASKQTLYVFLSLTGEYIAANYTGKQSIFQHLKLRYRETIPAVGKYRCRQSMINNPVVFCEVSRRRIVNMDFDDGVYTGTTIGDTFSGTIRAGNADSEAYAFVVSQQVYIQTDMLVYGMKNNNVRLLIDKLTDSD